MCDCITRHPLILSFILFIRSEKQPPLGATVRCIRPQPDSYSVEASHRNGDVTYRARGEVITERRSVNVYIEDMLRMSLLYDIFPAAARAFIDIFDMIPKI